jgi:hypothetical protein
MPTYSAVSWWYKQVGFEQRQECGVMPTPSAALRACSTRAARAAEESPHGVCTRYDPFRETPPLRLQLRSG